MKYSELIRLLSQQGWTLSRSGGAHDIYKHQTIGGSIPIPRHYSKEVPPGTLNSIMKKAGLK